MANAGSASDLAYHWSQRNKKRNAKQSAKGVFSNAASVDNLHKDRAYHFHSYIL